jgi:hypothetical protein
MGPSATWAPASCTAPIPTPTARAVARTQAPRIADLLTSPLSHFATYRGLKVWLSSS